MGRIDIKNIDELTIVKIDSLAKKRNMSRQAFLKTQLDDLAIAGDLKAVEDKYANLVNLLADVIKANTEELNQVKSRLDEMERSIHGK